MFEAVVLQMLQYLMPIANALLETAREVLNHFTPCCKKGCGLLHMTGTSEYL